MAFNYSPKIVTDGLVLYLDAANNKSYPGSGITWSDISRGGNNVTLTNGPTFSTAGIGSIVFDGVDDYCDFYTPNLGTTTTVEMWCKIGSVAAKMMFGWLLYDVYGSTGHLGFNTGNGDLYGIPSATVTSLGLLNNWVHYIFEMRSDVSYTNNKMYINSIPQSLSQIAGTENSNGRNFNSGNGRIAGWRTNNSYRMPMECSSFKIYNRALSATEVLQNYNATKTRFGLT
jgi:hypothetical protein